MEIHSFRRVHVVLDKMGTAHYTGGMKMILMGTGTSHGVPVIACTCKVCSSTDPRDARLRCSAYITDPANIVIDIGPEFRIQALRHTLRQVDAVLLTHSHADHLHGLDDLRIFSHTRSSDASEANPDGFETAGNGIPIYTNPTTVRDIQNRFDYVFKTVQLGGGKPKLDLEDCSVFTPQRPLAIRGLRILPVPLLHGQLEDSGWLVTQERADGSRHSIAYLTDCNEVPADSMELIATEAGTLTHLVIDGLRIKPHATHFSFEQAMAVAERLRPRHTWFTHITHDLFHTQIQAYVDAILPTYPALSGIVAQGGSVAPAYDGLVLEA